MHARALVCVRACASLTVRLGAVTPCTGTQFEEEALMPGDDEEDPSLPLDALGETIYTLYRKL